MKAILTKTLYATNTKPTRIKASAEGVPSHTWSRSSLEDELQAAELSATTERIHWLAASKLCAILSWDAPLVSGGLPDGTWAHCFTR